MGDYTEEEFRREFVDELTEDEEYETDSRRIAHVEECSGLDRDIFSKYGAHLKTTIMLGTEASQQLCIVHLDDGMTMMRLSQWQCWNESYIVIGGTFLAGRQPDKDHLVRLLKKKKTIYRKIQQ